MLHRRTPTRIGLAVASAAALLLAGCSTQDNADTSTETSAEAAATSSAESSADTSASSTVTSTAIATTAAEETASAAPPQVTTTVVAQAPAEADAGGDQAPNPAPAPAPQPTSEAAPAPAPAAPAVPASTESIYGQPVTHCSSGNGFRVTDLWVGANTSCDFAFNTLGTLAESRNSGTDDLRLSMPASVRVYSPVTGGSYDMSCSMMDQRMIQCTGGDGASVYLSMY